MRIRIALATATAVIALPAIFFAVFSSTSAASPRVIRQEASSQHPTVKIDDTLMSYSQAEYVAEMVTYSNAVELDKYSNAVELAQEEAYLTEVAYLKSLSAEQQYLKALATQRQVAAQAAAAQAATPATGRRRTGTSTAGAGARADRRSERCHEHQHGRLGLHPSTRVQ